MAGPVKLAKKWSSPYFESRWTWTRRRGLSKEGISEGSLYLGTRIEKGKQCFAVETWNPIKENSRPAESRLQKHGNTNNGQGAKSEIYRRWPLLLHILEEKKKSVKKTNAACGCGGSDSGRLTNRPWAWPPQYVSTGNSITLRPTFNGFLFDSPEKGSARRWGAKCSTPPAIRVLEPV